MDDNDLISRAAAIAEIDEYLQGLNSCISEPELKLDGYKNGLQVAIQELKELPAVDAALVIHGRWVYEDSDPMTMPCSNCNYRVFRYNNTPFCPNCGADMREVTKRNEDR